ncbi:MAG TPA: FAD-binding protein [Myxococcota bacterium]|nr:FAD-binding protein [Myxococcota bacterium]
MVSDAQCELQLDGVELAIEARDEDPSRLAAARLGVPLERVIDASVVRRSIDSRHGRPRFVLGIRARLSRPPEHLPLHTHMVGPPSPLAPARTVAGQRDVAVVGAGPAGLFAAMRLCQAGLRPLLVERGRQLAARHGDIAALVGRGQFQAESNFHFGLGGAGAYSDGKLFTRLHQPAVRHVLEVLQASGAGSRDQILVDAQPHVGSDRWPQVLANLHGRLEDDGCRFVFETKVVNLSLQAGKLRALVLEDGRLACEGAVLAPGNSARDLFAGLHEIGLPIAAKPFAVGLRMTHPQELIDAIQYGNHPGLGPASYRLTARVAGRSVYTFCMCPGGTVIPTPTEADGLTTNGMSTSARDSGEANAGVVAAVSVDDFGGEGFPLEGVRFQQQLERAAFAAGGGGFRAPAQRLVDFMRCAPGARSARLPAINYRPAVTAADVGALMPDWLSDALRGGLAVFCKKMRGLDHPRAAVIGLETRTSSPVRILRGPDGASPGCAGLYPAGEGSGYAGGIVSSAIDGIRAADALIDRLCG